MGPKKLLLFAIITTLPALTVPAQNLTVDVNADPQSICEGGTATLTAIPTYTNQPERNNTSGGRDEATRPTVTVTFASSVSQGDFTVNKADLKFDKQFAFSIQVDDGLLDIYEKALPLLEGGEYQGEQLPGLYFTDGCGNDVSFKMATAHYSWNSYNQNDMHDPENGYNDLGDFSTMTWDQMIELYQSGWGVYNHGFLDNGTSGESLYYDIIRNHSYTRRNTHPDIESGINMNLFVIPGSALGLGPVAIDNGYNQVISVNYASGDPYYNINEDEYYNTEISRHFGLSEIYSTAEELANVAAGGEKAMSTTGLHDFSFQEFRDEVEAIEEDYGASGSNNIWFTTSEEVIQYLYVRDNIQLATNVSSNTVTISFNGDLPDDLRFYALSLLIDSEKEITDIEITDGFNNTHNLDFDGQALVNLNWDERVITPPEDLAEEYVSIAEETEQTTDALIGMDYTEMIADTSVRNYYRSRLCAISGVELPEGYCAQVGNYTYQWSADGELISNAPAVEVSPAETTTYEVTVNGGDQSADGQVTVEVTPEPVIEAQPDDSTCANQSYTLTLQQASNYSQILWETSGDGTFSDNSIEEPSYFPGDNDMQNGQVQLTATAIAEGCDNAQDSLLLNFIGVPEINMTEQDTICENSTYSLELNPPIGTSVSWSTTGDGQFSTNSGANTTYTPGSNDITSGQVTIISTFETGNPCNYVISDSLDLTVALLPIAEAGSDTSVCPGSSSVTLSGNASNFSSASWSSDGTGEFSSNGINATYLFSDQDVQNGQVEFFFEVSAQSPCTGSTTDSMLVDILPVPGAFAGNDTTACAYTPFYLQGTAENYGSVYWTTEGDGYFSAPNNLSSYYTFGEEDKTQSEITLTLHSVSPEPCNSESTDDIVLTLPPQPEIYAGDDDAICIDQESYQLSGEISGTEEFTWITQGDGTFSDPDILNPVYYPGEEERAQGAAYPGLKAPGNDACGDTIQDYLLLIIEDYPSVDAGNNQTICTGTAAELEATADNYSSVMWTTDGDGTFENPQSLETTYFPGEEDEQQMNVKLYVTASNPDVCEGEARDSLLIFPDDPPAVETNSSITVCETTSAVFCTGDAENFNNSMWTTSGTGQFANPAALSTNYFPTQADINSGEVMLILTVTSSGGCQTEDADTLTVSFQPIPFASAGEDITICETDSVSLNGEVSDATSYFWSTSGDGVFENNNSLITTYYPGSNDIQSGSVLLQLTAQGISPCDGSVTDNKIVTIDREAGVNIIPASDSIYAGDEYTVNSNAVGYSNIMWVSSGFGEMESTNQPITTYHSVAQDTLNQPLTLQVTAYPLGSCSSVATDNMTLYATPPPEIYAGQDIETCVTATEVGLNGSSEIATTFTWTSSGDGSFENPGALQTTYYPSQEDISSQQVQLTLSADSNPEILNDSLMVYFHDPPTCDIEDEADICGNDTLYLEPEVTNATFVEWNGSGDGVFTQPDSAQTAYTPGIQDINQGNVTLTITAYSEFCSDSPASDEILVTIDPSPTAFAGNDTSICSAVEIIQLSDADASNYNALEWTSSGSGEFSNTSILHPDYYPSNQDVVSGQVTLTLSVSNQGLCSSGDEDSKTVFFSDAPSINIDGDYYSCDGSMVELEAQATDFSSIGWLSAGDGEFIDNTGVLAVYVPGENDIAGGAVTLSAIAYGNGVCNEAADTAYTAIDIVSEPTVNAGSDITTCENSILLNGESSASQVTWSTDGSGSFSNENLLSCYYIPSDEDFNAGEVTLTLLAEESAGDCNLEATDDLQLTLQNLPDTPEAPVGPESICQGESSESQFVTTETEGADKYIWFLTPEARGAFTQDTTPVPQNTVVWSDNPGSFVVNVKAMNGCGQSGFSEGFHGNYYPSPDAEIEAIPDSIACMNQTITLDATAPNISSYLWQPGNFLSSEITVVSTDFPGYEETYSITITNIYGCSDTDSIEVLFTECTSATEATYKGEVKITPNPATDFINITYHEKAQITILNSQGKTIRKIRHNFTMEPNKRVPVSEFPPGIYFIRIESDNSLHIHKFVHLR